MIHKIRFLIKKKFPNSENRIKDCYKYFKASHLPYNKIYAIIISSIRDILFGGWQWTKTFFIYYALIKFYCDEVGERITFQGTFPLIENYGKIILGSDVTFVGNNNLFVINHVKKNPILRIGDNVTIGYQNEINVADKIVIGNNVRMATGVRIFDNNAHPIDPELRDQKIGIKDIAPVIIENGVWIGINGIILKGVKIGENSIIGAGAVVTRDVPKNCIAIGNPAIIVKMIGNSTTA